MAYTTLVRCTLKLALWQWRASYRVTFGYRRPVVPADIVRCATYASELDLGGPYTGDGIKKLRAVQSILLSVTATQLPGPSNLEHLLLINDAVGHGEDSFPPVLSAGQAVGLEWITGQPGRGKNGRTYFPYFAAATFDLPSVDTPNTAATDFILTTCSAFAFSAPVATGGELVVYRRQLGGLPANPLDSAKIVDVRIPRATFTHQRRRVEWRVPLDASP